MGLTTWKNSPDGRILKSDSKIAKNYLSEGEIRKFSEIELSIVEDELRKGLTA